MTVAAFSMLEYKERLFVAIFNTHMLLVLLRLSSLDV